MQKRVTYLGYFSGRSRLGLLTIKEGGTVLFGGEAARIAAGNFVPLCSGSISWLVSPYVIAGAGLWLRRRWAVWLAVHHCHPATATRSVGFGAHIFHAGGDL